jgi:hypothetical protein
MSETLGEAKPSFFDNVQALERGVRGLRDERQVRVVTPLEARAPKPLEKLALLVPDLIIVTHLLVSLKGTRVLFADEPSNQDGSRLAHVRRKLTELHAFVFCEQQRELLRADLALRFRGSGHMG